MNWRLDPQAEIELKEAAAFYENRAGAALATAFITEFERVANLIAGRPGLGTPAKEGWRIFPLRRFPYSLVYRTDPEGIRILVVGHQHRRPKYRRGR